MAPPRFVEVFFLTHRWLRATHPDTEDGAKARALAAFVRYRQGWVRAFRGGACELVFWIDVACVDQAAPQPDLAKLPLWIACCSHLVTFSAADYGDRAWCRLEQVRAARRARPLSRVSRASVSRRGLKRRVVWWHWVGQLLAAGFMRGLKRRVVWWHWVGQLLAAGFMFTDHQSVIGVGFDAANIAAGTILQADGFRPLLDPAGGRLTCEADRAVIARFSALGGAALSRRKGVADRSVVAFGETPGLRRFDLMALAPLDDAGASIRRPGKAISDLFGANTHTAHHSSRAPGTNHMANGAKQTGGGHGHGRATRRPCLCM